MKAFDLNHEKYHLGHFIMDSLKRNGDFICQTDAATGENETCASVLRRSIQLARCLRNFGLKPGDVMTLGGRNHLDLCIPFYAATMNGLPVAGLDSLFRYSEIKSHFKLCLPKVAFCEREHVEDHLRVIRDLGLDTKLICFGNGEYSMERFIEEYDELSDDEGFSPLDFDLNEVFAFIMTTSGTTSIIKMPAFTHKIALRNILGTIEILPKKNGDATEDNKPVLHLSPFFWLTSYLNIVRLPYMKRVRLTTSAPTTVDHVIDIINKYKPIYAVFGPPLAKALVKSEKTCDFSCFAVIALAGSKIQKDILLELRNRCKPGAKVVESYGLSETLGSLFSVNADGPLNNCGKDTLKYQKVKLVDTKTSKEVTEPNVPGELWVIPSFSLFYNNPELSATTLTEDGWYKTGDILYRDEDGNYFFVERIKMIIICRSYHIIPAELANVIIKHPGVQDVAITSIPHKQDGEHPVACVVKKEGAEVTAQELRDMIADELSESTQLLGGVVFMNELPLTSSGKVALSKLREIALTAHRE